MVVKEHAVRCSDLLDMAYALLTSPNTLFYVVEAAEFTGIYGLPCEIGCAVRYIPKHWPSSLFLTITDEVNVRCPLGKRGYVATIAVVIADTKSLAFFVGRKRLDGFDMLA
jgi:hypothetical protein